METCPHCGAATSSEDAVCPACGTPLPDVPGSVALGADGLGSDGLASDGLASDGLASDALAAGGEDGERDGSEALGSGETDAGAERAEPADVTSIVDSAEGELLEPPIVPAGTWASASESEPPAAPANAFEREPDTRRVRRVRDAAEDGERHRVDRTIEARPRRAAGPRDSMARAEGVGRADAVARTRGRALAVAPSARAEVEERDDDDADAQVVAFPARAASASASSSGIRADLGGQPAAATPPKWLASEILREPTPTEPSGWTSRAIATAGGIAGAAASLVIGDGGPDLGMAALFVALAGLAIVPVPFAIRAGGFAVIASIGLALATWARIGGVEGEAIGLAILGTTLLAAAQLLRAVQRRSRFAKIASMLGIVVTGIWLALDGGLDAMVVHGTDLDDWLGPLVRAVLMIVLALSLLGFLDDSGSSGNHVWPWLVLGWIALEAAVTIAMVGTDRTLATAATPIFSAVAALGWMQVWATTPGLGAREPARARHGDG